MSNEIKKARLKKKLVQSVYAKDRNGIIQAARGISENGYLISQMNLSSEFMECFTRTIIELKLDRKNAKFPNIFQRIYQRILFMLRGPKRLA